jgi:hypothetical protein
MRTSYSIGPVGPGQVLLTLPLAQILDASLTAERWQGFSRQIADAGRGGGMTAPAGVMALRNSRGYFIGIFTFNVQLTLRHGRTLTINDLVVADEELHVTALSVLGKSLRELAQSHRCGGIEVVLPGGTEASSYLRRLAKELGSPIETANLLRASWRVELAPGPRVA